MEENTNKLTTVKTVYARIALILLALNFLLTGYAVMALTKQMDTRMDNATRTATQTASTERKAQVGETERKAQVAETE